MKTYYKTTFDFYYDENTMNIPEAIMESQTLSHAAKNIYIYFIYLITEGVENIIDVLPTIEEAKKDFEVGLAELRERGLIKKEIHLNDQGEEVCYYLVTKDIVE